MNETYLGGLLMSMKFGRVYRYVGKLDNGESVTWRVCAESRVDADNMVAEYLDECKNKSFYNVPTKIDFAGAEDNLVLF
jgi:hypothetical protein